MRAAYSLRRMSASASNTQAGDRCHRQADTYWHRRGRIEGAGTRTLDPRLKRPLLYLLSYALNILLHKDLSVRCRALVPALVAGMTTGVLAQRQRPGREALIWSLYNLFRKLASIALLPRQGRIRGQAIRHLAESDTA